MKRGYRRESIVSWPLLQNGESERCVRPQEANTHDTSERTFFQSTERSLSLISLSESNAVCHSIEKQKNNNEKKNEYQMNE
jgi:hypothetical protein